MTDNEKKIEQLALKILGMSRTKLLVSLRFLEMGVSRLDPVPKPKPDATKSLATDGASLMFSPKHILSAYQIEENLVTRDYLHSVFHCVFCHMFVDPSVDRVLWDVACDIAVESTINDMGLESLRTLKAQRQAQIIEGYKSELPVISAEKVYRFLRKKKLSRKSVETLGMLFRADDHFLWYLSDGEKAGLGLGNGKGREQGEQTVYSRTELEKDWKRICERVKTDIEMFGKRRGFGAGLLEQNLREADRERYNYAEFLKKFAVRGEVMRLNDEEFDYNYYTYGLELYEDMPLIEPLEYKEVKAVREFVIAVDTSASTSGELVRKFVQKTYNILQSTESFFSKVNLHIIQCDAAIQEDFRITCREDFDDYIKNMTVKGLGGTDFRPVFSYVNSLVETGELKDLKGLIYFTDGQGIFPAKMPRYQTAFVFIDDAGNDYNVPSWAIKLILDEDGI